MLTRIWPLVPVTSTVLVLKDALWNIFNINDVSFIFIDWQKALPYTERKKKKKKIHYKSSYTYLHSPNGANYPSDFFYVFGFNIYRLSFVEPARKQVWWK